MAAGDLKPTGDCTVDTTALTLSCESGPITAGQPMNGVAVFTFNDIAIPTGVTVKAAGSRPLRLVSEHDITVEGTIDGSGSSATAGSAAPVAGGPGGGNGGAPGMPGSDGFNAPGGGGSPATNAASGAGGGSYVGKGGAGEDVAPGSGGGGGIQNSGDGQIRGGSGGGGGTGVSGGGGGGSIELDATNRMFLQIPGTVDVSGGSGAAGTQPSGGASGGGSAGLIVFRATSIRDNGIRNLFGGDGGAGQCCGDGGGGAGGQIADAYHGEQFVNDIESYRHFDGGGPQSSHGAPGQWEPVSDDPFANTYQTPTDDPSVAYNPSARRRLTTQLADLDDEFSLLLAHTNQAVQLYRKTASGWAFVGTSTTIVRASDGFLPGEAALYVGPHKTTLYRWRWVGQDFAPPATQDVTFHVRYATETHVNHYSVRHGVPITVYGYVAPNATGENVWLKRYTGGTWVNLTSAVIKKQKLPNGTTRTSFKFVRSFSRGTVKLEAVKPAGAGLDKGTSRTLTIKVS